MGIFKLNLLLKLQRQRQRRRRQIQARSKPNQLYSIVLFGICTALTTRSPSFALKSNFFFRQRCSVDRFPLGKILYVCALGDGRRLTDFCFI